MLPLPVTIPVCIALIAGIGYWLARMAQDRRSSATPEQTGRNGGNTATQRDAHPDAHAVADTVPIDNGDEELVERVNALLPQTQCAQCGHPGCRPYAQAIIHDNAAINRCPPGGDTTITQLAELLGLPVIALDAEVGEEPPAQVALIDEAACIGCTLCIHACPVDAIVGTSKMMHTVVSDQCTGCELCIPPCPVDCISLPGKPLTPGNWTWPKPV